MQVDAKIVEVALFFQRELLQAQAGHMAAGGGGGSSAAAEQAPPISVLLLSADNAQVRDSGALKPQGLGSTLSPIRGTLPDPWSQYGGVGEATRATLNLKTPSPAHLVRIDAALGRALASHVLEIHGGPPPASRNRRCQIIGDARV